MSESESPAEIFKRSTAATVRAIAERDDVQVTYGADRKVVDSWRPYLESRIGKDIAELERAIRDQEAYGRVARRLIQDLDLGDSEDATDSDEAEGEGDEAENSEGQTEGGESSAAG